MGGRFKESRAGGSRRRLDVTIYLSERGEMDAWRIERRVEKDGQLGRRVSERRGRGREREVKERESGQCLSLQTGGAVGSAHHLWSSDRMQERPKVSQLANGSERDPPIRTVETDSKESN